MTNWPTKKLGEICEENIKSPFKVEDATNSGEYPFFTSGESVLTHDEYLVDGENIFLATGGYANVKYYNGKASYSTDTWSLKVKNALTKFVFYQILARLKYIDEVLFRGSGLRHLQKKEFLNLEIPLPPLPIQQKIVKILDTIQEAVEIQEKIIEKTKELKKSLMNLLFHFGIKALSIKELASSRVGELTSSEIEKLGLKLKKTEVGEIPEDWEVVRLGEICEIVYGVQASVSELKEEAGRIPILTNKNITDEGTIDLANLNFYPEDLIDSKKHLLKKGDIIFNWRSGSVEHVGKSALFNLEGKFTFASFLLRFRPKPNVTNSYFLNSYLNKTRKEGFLKFFAHQASINQSLNASISSNISIPLPTLPEQREIAEILQTIDQKIEIEKKKKELYEELFKTMLNKIMSQEIDVEKVRLE
jgi:type I restriction enzyme S subunit